VAEGSTGAVAAGVAWAGGFLLLSPAKAAGLTYANATIAAVNKNNLNFIGFSKSPTHPKIVKTDYIPRFDGPVPESSSKYDAPSLRQVTRFPSNVLIPPFDRAELQKLF